MVFRLYDIHHIILRNQKLNLESEVECCGFKEVNVSRAAGTTSLQYVVHNRSLLLEGRTYSS